MNIELKVKYPKDVPELERLKRRLANPAPLMQRLGKGLEIVLHDHFDTRNLRPNRRNWPKTGFWERIRKATTFTDFSAKGATVSISEGKASGAKLYGGHIKPTDGRKYLAIPAVPERNGISPRAADDRDRLVFRRGRRGGVLGWLWSVVGWRARHDLHRHLTPGA